MIKSFQELNVELAFSEVDTWCYAFILDWYEEHRKVKKARIYTASKIAPFRGQAFRVSAHGKFDAFSSWSKDLASLRKYYGVQGEFRTAFIHGVDLERMAKLALRIDPKNSDIQDIANVREVIALEVENLQLV